MRIPKALAAVAALALLLTGCGGNGSGGDPTTSGTPTAATTTAEVSIDNGADLAEFVGAAMEGLKQVGIRMEYVDGSGPSLTEMAMELHADVTDPKVHVLLAENGATSELISIGSDAWSKQDDGSWVVISAFDVEEVLFGLDTKHWKDLFGTGSVEDLGNETIDGVVTKRFHVNGNGFVDGAAVESVDVWVDSTGRVIRVNFSAIGSDGTSGTVSIEYFDFDVPVDIQPPM